MTLRSLSTSGISNALKKSNNPSLANSTGGVITTAGGYRIHTFSSYKSTFQILTYQLRLSSCQMVYRELHIQWFKEYEI